MGRSVTPKSIFLLSFISFLAIALITFFKSALELEDAEQAYYSQWLRWGYDDQPPLFSWIQYGANTVLGVNKLSFSILRGLIFAGTLMILYSFAKTRIKETEKAKLTVLVLVLVPVYIDFTFRRLSHTSLLCFAIVGTYYCIQLILNETSVRNYIMLGMFTGIGLLSKYNYLFFLIAFFTVSFWDRSLRRVIWKPKILISIVISTVGVAPHIMWLFGSEDYQTLLMESIQQKTMGEPIPTVFSIEPLLMFGKGFLAATLMIALGLLVGHSTKNISMVRPKVSWLLKLFYVQLGVLGTFFLVSQSQKVEVRWIIPLFLPFTVLLMESLQFKNGKKWVNIGFYVFYGVVLLQTARTPIEKILDIPSSVHYGFKTIANKLEEGYEDSQWVLPNVTYAGNVRLFCHDRFIYSADDYSLKLIGLPERKMVRITIGKLMDLKINPVDSIMGFGKEKENLYFYTDLRD